MKQNKYVIGVDGGGTKTVVALVDLEGKVLKVAKVGPSSPVNVGVKTASKNIAEGIKKVLRKGEIISTFIGLAAIQEEPRYKKEIRRELLKRKGISQIFKGKIEIGSDQIVAFRSGTDKKDGVLIIAGTGCVAHSWHKDKEITASGWHWLADEGSAFWVGQRAFQAVLKNLDARGPKTLITNLAFKEFKIKTIEAFLEKVYASPAETVPLLSVVTDEASKKGDKVAKEILKQAGRELALAAKTAIKKLEMEKEKFPLVLVGGMFKSKIVLETVKKEVKRAAPKVGFIQPQKEPVSGAIKLALERIRRKNRKFLRDENYQC